MKKLIYATAVLALSLAAGGSAWAQGSAHDSLPKVGEPEYYENNPSDAALQLEYERERIAQRDRWEREMRAQRQLRERERIEREARARELWERERRERRDWTARRQPRDRDGDGILNRHDRYPDDPYWH